MSPGVAFRSWLARDPAQVRSGRVGSPRREAGRGIHGLDRASRTPGRVQLRPIKGTDDQPSIDLNALESDPIELLPSESARFLMAITLGAPNPVELIVVWLDSRGEQVLEMPLANCRRHRVARSSCQTRSLRAMTLRLFINDSSWHLQEGSDRDLIEQKLCAALASGPQTPEALTFPVVIEGEMTTLHIRRDAIATWAVIDTGLLGP
jgi:hypothetical protein